MLISGFETPSCDGTTVSRDVDFDVKAWWKDSFVPCRKGEYVEMPVLPKPQFEHTVIKHDTIAKLKSLQRSNDGCNVHGSAETVICDFLDAVGYEEIAREFRKVREMYPVVVPRYSRPSWRS
ncbi:MULTISPECIES: hypothetical protein [Bradyrhizobium]|uniref:hypothetical protein n=1 Tax=Bradyrhizobium TaxID=374 RepID=UPI0019572969|nr:hypothetical protein [Bradyrhizobium canariense]MBM7486037.1 hypothetical protein [Bradyrhizobium canariense]